MNRLHIENILGFTAHVNSLRATLSGDEYRELIPAPEWKEEIVKRDATVEETVAEMIKLIKKYNWQTRELSKRLLGKDINDTCRKIWNFLFYHIRYKEDEKGEEQLRTPALSWYLRRIRGIDCDDFSIFAGCILYNLGIPFYLRIAKYKKDYFQHVYVVVPGIKEHYFVVDAVLDKYDLEKEPSEILDFLVMDNTRLNGINISVLSGIEDDTSKELEGILSGDDFSEYDRIEESGEEPSEEVGLNAIKNYLIRTRDFARRNPHMIRAVEDPQAFLGMVDYALRYWDTPQREKALHILSQEEHRQNILNGVGDITEGYEDTGLFYGLDGMNGTAVLGRAKAPKAFFKSVKTAVSAVKKKADNTAIKLAPKPLKKTVQKAIDLQNKAGQKFVSTSKKALKQVVRFDPAVLTIRAGILAALKMNVLKIAERLKLGYLTEAEARTHGFDIEQWAKARKVLKDSENLFVNVYQGKPEAFRNAILTGRAGGLGSIYTMQDAEEMTGLGAYAAAAAGGAATTAAASATPWIKKVMELMKNVDWGKLIKNVNAAFLNRKKKKAEKENERDNAAQTNVNTESSQSTDQSSETSQQETNELPDEKTTAIPKDDEPGEGSDQGSGDSSNKTDENTSQENNPGNLPDTTTDKNTSVRTKENAKENTTDEPSAFDKFKDWVVENKTPLIVVGGLVLALGVGTAIYKGRKAKGFSGAGKGKSAQGKKKKNPPSIAGTGKRKGKGGTPNVKI